MPLPQFDLAQAVGFIGFALGILCFYQRDDRKLKRVMVVMGLNNAIHYAMLGATTALLSALLSVVRTYLALHTSSRWVAAVFIVLGLTSGGLLAEHWVDMIPVLGTCIGAYAVFCLQGIPMRIAFFAGALCWLANNIIVGSIGLTLLEMVLISVNLSTIWRLHRAKQVAQPA